MHIVNDCLSIVNNHMSPIQERVDSVVQVEPNESSKNHTPTGNRNPVLPKSNALIRTGCIPCLHDGFKCDGSNPRCRRKAITAEWRINSEFTAPQQGTWRERHGLHVFLSFAMSPERAGLFESPFWHYTVMQACFQSAAVFHVASAIGALQEYCLKPAADENGLAFALQQCNRSISLLTASSEESEGANADPGIALITCVLFTVFEALMGHPCQAITHSLQSRKLLENCEHLAAMGHKSQFMDTNLVLPVIYGLERQAKAVQGMHMSRTDTSNDPALPDVNHIYSLQHANWTLYFTWTMLTIFCQDTKLGSSPIELSIRMAQKEAIFMPWLKSWEQSFSDFLFRESAKLTKDDLQRARVLKANHIAASITAKNSLGRLGGWPGFYNDYKAIIDLSASVLNTYGIYSGSELPTFHFPFLTFGLWVSEPLFIVMARCHDQELRRQAAGLLSGQACFRRSRRKSRQPARTLMSNDSRLEGPTDTDAWGVDEWLEFVGSVRLDTAMATYFGRLPSEYIAKPVFPARGV